MQDGVRWKMIGIVRCKVLGNFHWAMQKGFDKAFLASEAMRSGTYVPKATCFPNVRVVKFAPCPP